MIASPLLARLATRIGAVGLLAVTIVACQTTQNAGSPGATAPLVRQSVETAPTDLQLLCASEAANRMGADSTSVLPTGSSVLQPSVYQVQLNVAGAPATCVIDDNGTIHSIG